MIDRILQALLYGLRLDRLCGWLVRQLEPDRPRAATRTRRRKALVNLEEVKANIGHDALWRVVTEGRAHVVIQRVIEHLPGYSGPGRVIVRFVGFSSETDVAPEELTLE